METAGTFACERGDCPREVQKDCSLCDRPFLSRKTVAVLEMYNKCKGWDALPGPGGVLDQPVELMELLTIVNNRAMHWKQKRSDDQQADLLKERMKHKR